jgi:predicted nucleic acid binding AN1-type Zn finger protein
MVASIIEHSPDVVCLQELDNIEAFRDELQGHGYNLAAYQMKRKRNPGCSSTDVRRLIPCSGSKRSDHWDLKTFNWRTEKDENCVHGQHGEGPECDKCDLGRWLSKKLGEKTPTKSDKLKEQFEAMVETIAEECSECKNKGTLKLQCTGKEGCQGECKLYKDISDEVRYVDYYGWDLDGVGIFVKEGKREDGWELTIEDIRQNKKLANYENSHNNFDKLYFMGKGKSYALPLPEYTTNEKPCETCNGAGKTDNGKCSDCKGTGGIKISLKEDVFYLREEDVEKSPKKDTSWKQMMVHACVNLKRSDDEKNVTMK